MPAKKTVNKESIVKAAADLVMKEGIEGLNARALAKELNCSTQPIYFCFKNMDEVKEEVKMEAERRYREKVKEYIEKSDCSKYEAYGMGFVRFAKEYRSLFRFLYMCERKNGREKDIEDVNEFEILKAMQETYGFSEEKAKLFHYDMAVYSYGLAVMVNTGYVEFMDEEISQRLQLEFIALSKAYGGMK